MILSCERNKVSCILDEAESFLPAMPDSTDSVLSLIKDYRTLDDYNKALYGLLRTYTDYKINKAVDNDSLLRPSYIFFVKNNDLHEIDDTVLLRRCGWCCYLMGRYYASIDSTKECEDNLRSAIMFSNKCRDYRTEYLSCSYLSDNIESSNIKESINLSRKALDYCLMSENDPDNNMALLGKISGKYIVSGNLDSAYIYASKMYDKAIASDNSKRKSSALMLFSLIELEKGNPYEALKLAKEGVSDADSAIMFNSRLTLAQCYYDCDSIGSAKSVLEKMLPALNYEQKYSVCWFLAEIAAKENDAIKSQEYNDSAHLCSEQMYYNALSVKDKYYRDIIQSEQENTKLAIEKGEKQKQIYLFLIIILLLVQSIVYGYIYFRRKYKKMKEKRIQSVENHRNHVRHYIEMIKIKDKEHEKGRILLMNQAISQCGIYIKTHSQETYKGKHNLNIKSDDWLEAEEIINTFCNDRAERIMKDYPELNTEQYQLCILTILKIENRIICDFLHITERTLQKRRQVIKERIFGVKDSKSSLDKILSIY